MSKRIHTQKVKTVLIPLIILLFFISCGPKLTVYKIQERPEDYNAPQTVNDRYDEDAKLGYTILRDADYLYVNISTAETASQLKIIQNGVILFLDKEGKKNEDFYIQYPLASENAPPGNLRSLGEDKTALLKKRISGLKDDILMVNGDDQEFINRHFNDDGITTEIKVVEEELYYQIKFPIGHVATNSSKHPNLGIAIKGLDIKASRPAPSASTVNRGSGMRGGGMRRGGMRGGGGRGGTTAPGKAPSSQMQVMASNVEIWMKLDLGAKYKKVPNERH